MSRLVFYELPPVPHTTGVAQLICRLVDQGPLAVVVGTEEEAERLSEALWSLPPSLLVPHGIAGRDADEELDPVVICIGESRSSRPVMLLATAAPADPSRAELVVEVVPRDQQQREISRRRFRAYKDEGKNPEFVPWDTWSREVSDA